MEAQCPPRASGQSQRAPPSALPDAVLARGLLVQAHGVAGIPVSLEELSQLLLHRGHTGLGSRGRLTDNQAYPSGVAEIVLRPVRGAWRETDTCP